MEQQIKRYINFIYLKSDDNKFQRISYIDNIGFAAINFALKKCGYYIEPITKCTNFLSIIFDKETYVTGSNEIIDEFIETNFTGLIQFNFTIVDELFSTIEFGEIITNINEINLKLYTRKSWCIVKADWNKPKSCKYIGLIDTKKYKIGINYVIDKFLEKYPQYQNNQISINK